MLGESCAGQYYVDTVCSYGLTMDQGPGCDAGLGQALVLCLYMPLHSFRWSSPMEKSEP